MKVKEITNKMNIFYKLRKEAHKTWEHAITDKLIYGFHNFNAQLDSTFIGYNKAIAMNLRGRWWEVLIKHRNGDFYCVIIEPMFNHSRSHIKSQPLPTDCDSTMLVTVRKFLQQVEGMTCGIRCIVWLKRLDDKSGIIGDILQESLDFAYSRFIVSPIDREGCSLVGFYSRKESQLPHDIIESGMEIVQDITHNNPNTAGNSKYFNAIDIGGLIRIGVSATDEWFSILPCADKLIEFLQVIRRPVDLQPWPIEWVHMLCSKMTRELVNLK